MVVGIPLVISNVAARLFEEDVVPMEQSLDSDDLIVLQEVLIRPHGVCIVASRASVDNTLLAVARS